MSPRPWARASRAPAPARASATPPSAATFYKPSAALRCVSATVPARAQRVGGSAAAAPRAIANRWRPAAPEAPAPRRRRLARRGRSVLSAARMRSWRGPLAATHRGRHCAALRPWRARAAASIRGIPTARGPPSAPPRTRARAALFSSQLMPPHLRFSVHPCAARCCASTPARLPWRAPARLRSFPTRLLPGVPRCSSGCAISCPQRAHLIAVLHVTAALSAAAVCCSVAAGAERAAPLSPRSQGARMLRQRPPCGAPKSGHP